jgi:hypothetical protein
MLAAGALVIAFSMAWRSHNVLRNLVLSQMDLNAGLILGIAFIVTWMISILGILQPNHITMGLVITNWALIIDAIAVITIGGIVWFYTLTPTNNFLMAWKAVGPASQQALQDSLHCCGYRNSTEFGIIAGFCTDPVFAAAQPGCSTLILPYAAYTLQNVFSSIYGLMAIVIGFFLSTVCIVYRRKQTDRFRRIDEKRGGGGFV